MLLYRVNDVTWENDGEEVNKHVSQVKTFTDERVAILYMEVLNVFWPDMTHEVESYEAQGYDEIYKYYKENYPKVLKKALKQIKK